MALRDDERFTIVAVASHYAGTWAEGENPPDAYLMLHGTRVAIEISTIMQRVTTNDGTHSRWSDDVVAIRLANDLNDMLNQVIPADTGVTLDLRPPIYNVRRTKAAIADAIRTIIAAPPTTWSPRTLAIADNTIVVHAHQHWGDQHKKVVGLVLHRNSHPNILQNAMLSLEERISEKTRACERVPLLRPLWLAFLNDYWLADDDTYRLAYDRLAPAHCFDRIVIIGGNNKVTVLFERSQS